ncbi:MAG: gamma-glutamyl phosphate reductase [Paenibacillaceae bacterium]|nr:gamma-glutamyl phosphate reductase [Paenibacillaceae bacterium]
MSEVKTKATLAREASRRLAILTTAQKNQALLAMADALVREQSRIIEANALDLVDGEANGTSVGLLDRLKLNEARILDMADGLRQVAELPDPIGETLESGVRPNGLQIIKVRGPIGVSGIIYEARPNVTVDAAGLALKTGNAVVLRGSSSALKSNREIVGVLREALVQTDVPAEALQLIEAVDRSSVDEMLKADGFLDVVIPRGGASLIQHVVINASVPVIETGAGLCHTYVEDSAEKEMALRIAINAKVQRPSVCNSMETLLLQAGFAERHWPELAERFRAANVELRGCGRTRELTPWIAEATEDDWGTEYNELILSVKVVGGLDEALEHIRRYGTMHSECIVTEDAAHAERFMQEVDAAAVYHNASTRFTDGFEFGYGAEIGISTQKLHARGPMGLPALTSTKFIVSGNGQIRE